MDLGAGADAGTDADSDTDTDAAFLARGRAGFVGRAAFAGARVERRFLGAVLARFLVAFLAGAALARFFGDPPRCDAVDFRGALLARFLVVFFVDPFVADFFAALVALRGLLLARFFVGCFVGMASPEGSTLSESSALATVVEGFNPRPRIRTRSARGEPAPSRRQGSLRLLDIPPIPAPRPSACPAWAPWRRDIEGACAPRGESRA